MGKPFMEPKEVKGLGLDDYYVEKRQKKEEAEAQQDMQLTQQDAHAKMAKDLSIELDEVDMQLFKHEFLGVVVVVTVAYVVIFAFAFSLVQLVAKLSIIFIVEPNSGLDALAAAIVMRTIRNTIDRGRTIVRTIHHPIIDIFKPLMRYSEERLSVLWKLGTWFQFWTLQLDVMKDPHIAADGYTYEGTAIKGWMYSGHDNSPATNLKLDTCDLIPNYPRYCTIQEW
ncbi:hypothetical protein FXO37_16509 [Capsicum annuum]|nr:hypothetical protein FXO37_16509 [Capsicum annuum]